MSIIDNFNFIKDEVEKTALASGRDPLEIKIIAVSKNFPAETVQEAVNSGIHVFGENRVQEAKAKFPHVKGNFSLHMIGHLQSNKARDAVRLFDLIHSIDKVETAEMVNREAEKIGKIQKILVQVNTSGEESKSGTDSNNCLNFMTKIADMKSVEVLGLMTMAQFTEDDRITKRSFADLRELLLKLNEKLSLNLKELSMGMSSDYKTAIEEGATMIRIGTAIFGGRP
jgi:pyridoxal phosphate enzyme (YggS family)